MNDEKNGARARVKSFFNDLLDFFSLASLLDYDNRSQARKHDKSRQV